MKLIVVVPVALALFVSACQQTLQPPKLTHQDQINVTPVVLKRMLVTQAQRCWDRQQPPKPENLLVSASDDPLGNTNIAVRYGDKSQTPFFTMDVSERGELDVYEGDALCGLSGCKRLELTATVQRWVAGDFTCVAPG